MTRTAWDVVIVGEGPAGLSAALTLGRCRRTVLLCDVGTAQLGFQESHGFMSRDGIKPSEFRRIAHKELRGYKNVVFHCGEVVTADREPDASFE